MDINEYLPIIIPLIILQIGLAIYVVVDILRHDKFRIGSKPIWIIVSIVISILGPILYFVFGKEER